MRTLLAIALLAGCGSDDGGGNAMIDAAGSGSGSDAAVQMDAPPSTGTFTLTSPTITEGGAIPLTHVCTNRGGMNQSPELAFANVPTGTMSFAVVLTDLSIQNGFIHSAIYDIPGTATGLPADVDKVYAPTDVPGAHQTNSYAGQRGYAGPCPPVADGPHMYQFKVYALATASLPNAMMNTSKDQVVTTATGSNLGTATLTTSFDP